DWTLEYDSGTLHTAVIADASTQRNWDGILAITQDSTSSGQATNASTLTFSQTVGSGQNGLLMVEVGVNGGTASAVTYNGTALTLAGRSNGNNNSDVEIWYLKAPVSGTHNIVVTTAGNATIAAGAASFFGVDQTTPLSAAVTTSGNNHTPSATIASGS